MVALATTQLSSKGQVVIPEEIRDRLGLKPGSRFVILGERSGGGGVVVLKTIEAPALQEFDALVSMARSQARKAGMKRSDVTAAVRKARGRR